MTSQATQATRYRQRQHGGGVNSWVYSYDNASPLTKSWVGCGLELGVQLAGEWRQSGQFTGRRTVGRGQIAHVSLGEQYAHEHDGACETGLQVGFILCADRHTEGELRFGSDAGVADPSFVAFCEDFARASDVDDAAVTDVVKAFIAKHCELAPTTPLVLAKRELERHFTCDLAMSHLADVGGLHTETFARQFDRTYGLTPAAYRIKLRTNYASRLLWTRPDLSIAEVAEESGFASPSYFHRTFRKAFGMSASESRARFVRDAA